jgi:hypothetical protein
MESSLKGFLPGRQLVQELRGEPGLLLRNGAAIPVPVRQHRTCRLYAAVRRTARHTWFHDPVFPFVHLPV